VRLSVVTGHETTHEAQTFMPNPHDQRRNIVSWQHKETATGTGEGGHRTLADLGFLEGVDFGNPSERSE